MLLEFLKHRYFTFDRYKTKLNKKTNPRTFSNDQLHLTGREIKESHYLASISVCPFVDKNKFKVSHLYVFTLACSNPWMCILALLTSPTESRSPVYTYTSVVPTRFWNIATKRTTPFPKSILSTAISRELAIPHEKHLLHAGHSDSMLIAENTRGLSWNWPPGNAWINGSFVEPQDWLSYDHWLVGPPGAYLKVARIPSCVGYFAWNTRNCTMNRALR